MTPMGPRSLGPVGRSSGMRRGRSSSLRGTPCSQSYDGMGATNRGHEPRTSPCAEPPGSEEGGPSQWVLALTVLGLHTLAPARALGNGGFPYHQRNSPPTLPLIPRPAHAAPSMNRHVIIV